MLGDLRKAIENKDWITTDRLLTVWYESITTDSDYGFYLFYKSWFYRAQGKQMSDESALVLSELKSLELNAQNPLISFLYNFRQGDWYFCQGKLGLAKDLFDKSISCFKDSKIEDPYEQAYALFHRALTYRDYFGFSVAIPLFLEVLKLSQAHNFKRVETKVFVELFFCYTFIGNYHESVICADFLSSRVDDIEKLLCQAHLLIMKKRFIPARKKLIDAYCEVKRQSLGRHRYDVHFHLAYLYAASRKFKRANLFITDRSDPIYRLQILELALEFDVRNRLTEYSDLNKKIGSVYHAERLRFFSQPRQRLIKLDILSGRLNGIPMTEKVLQLFRHVYRQGYADKKDIVTKVMGDLFYDSFYHDPKVYRLVKNANSLLKTEILLINQNGRYRLNPNLRLEVKESTASGLALEKIVATEITKSPDCNVRDLQKKLGLTKSTLEIALSTIAK